jgi:uncharacterized membrane protein YoaK (UPF0700 family)
MLKSEGQQRTDAQNRRLAGSLALVAGYVNSAGFVLIGTFTSHVTGNVGRLTTNAARGEVHLASLAVLMVLAFFAGAFVASMAIESSRLGNRGHVYGGLLLGEAATLLTFFAIARWFPSMDPRVHDAQAAVLCAAMGLQNSLVTRLSGAVVRTTHLTGVVTDLGIEAARWFRYARHHLGTRSRIKLVVSSTPAERPHGPKTALLVTIFAAFVAGSFAGALMVKRLAHLSLVVPVIGLVMVGVYALISARDLIGADARR